MDSVYESTMTRDNIEKKARQEALPGRGIATTMKRTRHNPKEKRKYSLCHINVEKVDIKAGLH